MGMESVFRLSVVLGMIDKLSTPMKGVENTVVSAGEKAKDRIEKMNKAFGGMQKAGAVMTGIGTGILGVAMKTVTSTFDTQNALGELSSLGVKDLKAVEDAAKSFSDTWAGTSKSDFIKASYDIKSGIASLSDEGVAEFTSLAALTGKATKSTTEEMGSLFATGYGIYKDFYSDLSDLEFGEVFSAGISTTVKNYKTSGSQMAASISALGATATNSNVPLEEQLTILGQLQTTMSGSEAATKYKSFLNQASSAGEKLGLQFLDTNNQLLAMPQILAELRGKYGDTIDAVEKRELKEAFGTDEAVALIDLLYNKTGTLESGIKDLGFSMQKGVDVTKEMASAINSTPEQKFTVLKQQIKNNVEELGNNLLPLFNDTITKVSELIKKGSDWIANNKHTVATIMDIVVKVGVLLVALGTVSTVVGTVGKVFMNLKNVFKIFKGVLLLVKGAFALLNFIMSLNPAVLIIVGIVALVAAFVYLWKKSEAFRNFWKGLFGGIKNIALNGLNAVKGFFGNILGKTLGVAKEKLNNIKNAYKENGGGIKGVVAASWEGIKGVYSIGFDILNNLTGGKLGEIKDKFMESMNGASDFVKNGLDSIKNWFAEKLTAVSDFVSGMIDKIKGFFGIELPTPKLKLPHLSIEGKFSIAPPSVPKLSVDWYAKGGVMTRPTIFGVNGGNLMGGGEAGEEAILPLSALWGKLGQFIDNAFRKEHDEGENGKESIATKLFSFAKKEVRSIEKKESKTTEREIREQNKEKKTIIQKVEIKLNIDKLKDLPTLFRLLDEIKESQKEPKTI